MDLQTYKNPQLGQILIDRSNPNYNLDLNEFCINAYFNNALRERGMPSDVLLTGSITVGLPGSKMFLSANL